MDPRVSSDEDEDNLVVKISTMVTHLQCGLADLNNDIIDTISQFLSPVRNKAKLAAIIEVLQAAEEYLTTDNKSDASKNTSKKKFFDILINNQEYISDSVASIKNIVDEVMTKEPGSYSRQVPGGYLTIAGYNAAPK